FLLEKSEPTHEVISLSWLVSNKLLYLFALADTRGRTTAEVGRPEEDVHLWRLVAEESGCFDGPYPFANDHARFLFYRPDPPNPPPPGPAPFSRARPRRTRITCRSRPIAAR